IGEAIVAHALSTIEIRTRTRCGQEHEAALLIHAHRRPDIGSARLERCGRQRIEPPFDRARLRVERIDDAGQFMEPLIVVNRRPHNHQSPRHHGRRGDGRLSFARRLEFGIDRHRPLAPETRARLSRLRIQRDQAAIIGVEEDARRANAAAAALPERHTAAVVVVGIPQMRIDLRIEAPQLLSRSRIDRAHRIERRTDIKPAIRQDRRILERRAFDGIGMTFHLAGRKPPGDFELADIRRGDLARGGIALSALVAAISRPAGLGARGRRRQQKRGQRSEYLQHSFAAHAYFPSLTTCSTATVCSSSSRLRIAWSENVIPLAWKSLSTLRTTSSMPSSSKSALTTSLAYSSAASPVTPISPAAHRPRSLLRRAFTLKRVSSSWAHLASAAFSRSLNASLIP